MVNPEHLSMMKGDVEIYENWRRENPDEMLDLRGADLANMHFLVKNLRKVDFTGANLNNCLFSMMGFNDVIFNSANLNNVDLRFCLLGNCNLIEANLSNANLSYSDIRLSNLNKANLLNADLKICEISSSNLNEADLSDANLNGTHILGSNLANTNLSRSNLRLSIIFSTNLINTNLTKSIMGFTTFTLCDFSSCIGLDTINIEFPNSIGIDAIITTYQNSGYRLSPDVELFYLNSGIPKEVLRELPRLISEIEYHTTFICYGGPDENFANKLYADLRSRGVSCWLYSLDATPGERVWYEIGLERREAGKMIVMCSNQALIRPGVLKEIEEQIDEDPDKIVPISLDNVWNQRGFRVMRGDRDLKPFLLERTYADFSDESKYNKSLNRLLKGLRR